MDHPVLHCVVCYDFIRQEKERSVFLTWLERYEAAAKLPGQSVSADRVKLEGELQAVQVNLKIKNDPKSQRGLKDLFFLFLVLLV